MLVVKNKKVSLRWEMNSILMQILQKNFFCIDHHHGRLVTWLQTKNTGAFIEEPYMDFWNGVALKALNYNLFAIVKL